MVAVLIQLVCSFFFENLASNLCFFSCTLALICYFLACPCSLEYAFSAYSYFISMIFFSQVENPMPCSCSLQVSVVSLSESGSAPSLASEMRAVSMSFSRFISARAHKVGSSSAVHTSTFTILENSKGSTNFSSITFSSKSVNFWVPVSTLSSYTSWQKQFFGKDSGISGSILLRVINKVSLRLSSSILEMMELLRSSKLSCSSWRSSFRLIACCSFSSSCFCSACSKVRMRSCRCQQLFMDKKFIKRTLLKADYFCLFSLGFNDWTTYGR